MNLDFDFLFKIIIIGDSGVGKTTLLSQYVDNIYNSNYISTIGVDFKIKTINVNNKVIKLQLWDTAGQERFRTITTCYYRGANIILMCYDITDKSTFINLNMWFSEIKKYASPNVIIILCGTKNDLELKRQVSYEEGKDYAEKNDFIFFETSSKENLNIDKVFENSTKKLLTKISVQTEEQPIQNKKNINANIETSFYHTAKKQCCY
jgi:Ras-related protein Rab-1A